MDILFLLALLYISYISHSGYGFVLPPITLHLNDNALYIHVRPRANGRYKIDPRDNGRVIPSVTLVSSSHVVGQLFSDTGGNT